MLPSPLVGEGPGVGATGAGPGVRALPSPLVGEGLGVGAAGAGLGVGAARAGPGVEATGAGPGVGATGAGPAVRGMRPLPPSPTRGEGGGPDVGRNICRPRSCAGGDRPMEGGMSAAPTNLLRGMPLSNPITGRGCFSCHWEGA